MSQNKPQKSLTNEQKAILNHNEDIIIDNLFHGQGEPGSTKYERESKAEQQALKKFMLDGGKPIFDDSTQMYVIPEESKSHYLKSKAKPQAKPQKAPQEEYTSKEQEIFKHNESSYRKELNYYICEGDAKGIDKCEKDYKRETEALKQYVKDGGEPVLDSKTDKYIIPVSQRAKYIKPEPQNDTQKDFKERSKRVKSIGQEYGIEKESTESYSSYNQRLIFRLMEEIEHYQKQNNELRKQTIQSVEESAQYKELLTQIEFEQKAHEQTKKELAKLKAQEPETAAAAITQEPEQTPQNDTQKEPVKVPELKRPDKGRPRRITSESDIEMILELRRQGYSYMVISQQFGTSDETISRICRKYGVTKAKEPKTE